MQQGTEFQRKESLHSKNSLECGDRLFPEIQQTFRNHTVNSEIVCKPLLSTVANSPPAVLYPLPPPHCFMHQLTNFVSFHSAECCICIYMCAYSHIQIYHNIPFCSFFDIFSLKFTYISVYTKTLLLIIIENQSETCRYV